MTPTSHPDLATAPPSGQQWTIAHGDWEACIVEVGGALRSLTYAGGPVLFGYDAAERADGGRGQILAPWPNRIRDGKYTFDGIERQLPLTEPGRGNASHGLVRWQPWTLVERSAHRLTVGVTVFPQPGWDWTLRLEITYCLDENGLTVTPRAHNLSQTSCPFGWGAHPYLTVGEASLDEVTLTAPVGVELVTDEQLIPVSTRPADPALSDGLALRDVGLDTCFTGLQTDADGRWRVRVVPSENPARGVTLWAEAAFGYLQVFTGDGLSPQRRRRSGLAVEPMTCPADAFNSGDGLITLGPDETWSASFGIGL